MKIAVLDGYTLNPGDLSWERLERFGSFVVHDRTPESEILSRSQGAEILMTNKTPLNAETIQALPDLKYIGVLATGYNIVDVQAAANQGIIVTNIPTYGTESVSQMVFAHLLNLARQVARHAETVRQDRWTNDLDWCYWDTPQIELDGLTMGILGFGRIGQATGALAHAFGMEVLAYDPYPPKSPPPYAKMAPIEDILKQADAISLHCPLTPENHHLMNRERLALMKPTAFLINTSRGPLIDEAALQEALASGKLAGAGLDVMETEPPRERSPLFDLENCFITPHISWATRSARNRLMNTAADNIQAYLDGSPANVVTAH